MADGRPDPTPDAGSDEDAWAGIVASFHGPSALRPGERVTEQPEQTGRTEPEPTTHPSGQPDDPGQRPDQPEHPSQLDQPDRRDRPEQQARPDWLDPADPTDRPGEPGQRGVGLPRLDDGGAAADDETWPAGGRPPAGAGEPPASPPDAGTVWRQHVPPDEPVEHFVPPEPPPLPQTDAITRAAWIGVLGAPALFVLAGILRWQLPGWGTALGLIGFVGGFALLVWRMRDSDPGGGPDDGAVV